jgi:flagellar biosynthetic protein FliR
MDILQLLPTLYQKLAVYILVFTRIGALLTTFTLFKREVVTTRIIISLTAILSFYVVLTYHGKEVTYDVLSIPLLIQMLFQSFIGLMSAFILNIIFEIFVAVGQITSSQIGLSMASLIDHRYGYITSLTHFYVITASIIFLFLNGHILAIQAIVNSFDVLPLYSELLPATLMSDVLHYAGIIFSGAVMLSITIMTVILLTNITLAVMTKFAPQFNLFSIGINMQVVIGLICVYATFELFFDNSDELITQGISFLQHSYDKMKPL